VVFFGFVYPSERHRIPNALMTELMTRMQTGDTQQNGTRLCRGTLVSRAQYLIDIGRYGYTDARLTPHGNMTPEDCIYWTWAIERID